MTYAAARTITSLTLTSCAGSGSATSGWTNCAFAASTLTITGSNYFPGATVALTGATGATDVVV